MKNRVIVASVALLITGNTWLIGNSGVSGVADPNERPTTVETNNHQSEVGLLAAWAILNTGV